MYCILCYCLVILFPWGWCRWDLVPVCVCIGIYVYIYMFLYTCIYLCMYKVEFCLLLWPLDLLSFDALLCFNDNKYVVILILIYIYIYLYIYIAWMYVVGWVIQCILGILDWEFRVSKVVVIWVDKMSYLPLDGLSRSNQFILQLCPIFYQTSTLYVYLP